MQMNSASHLLSEDREEFARILDDALRTAEYRPEGVLSEAGQHLSTEQLRAMALDATATIAACAAAEYHHYVQLRAELRDPASVPAYAGAGASGGERDQPSGGPAGLATATAATTATGTAGAGVGAMVSVLAPVLAGIAAVLFLLFGYLLRALGPGHAMAQPLISVGWIFAALAAVGSLLGMGGLIVTALRNGSAEPAAQDGPAAELEHARDAWRHALLIRGLLPFLRRALTGPAPGPFPSGPRHGPGQGAPESRIPTLGYSRPDFTSPDSGPAGPHPRYASPDFSSPDYGGPDHRPE
ncbi:hypothetical protein [Streptomyces celluloflavus]|uniref:hypothetical protein n=1 Tax=Streptomyces celluloflavus TaxID=58344 RepID=UPI00346028FF|nr:hypothetical protein OG717_18765 [Streptomyces celluloflavus]